MIVWIRVCLEKCSFVLVLILIILNRIIKISFDIENLVIILIVKELKYSMIFFVFKMWKILCFVILINWNSLIFLFCFLIKIVLVYKMKIVIIVISKIEVVLMVVVFLIEVFILLIVGLYWSVIKVK